MKRGISLRLEDARGRVWSTIFVLDHRCEVFFYRATFMLERKPHGVARWSHRRRVAVVNYRIKRCIICGSKMGPVLLLQ